MKRKYNLTLSFVIQFVVIFWGFLYYRILSGCNMLISLDDLPANVLNILVQHIIVNLPAIALFAIALKRTGNETLFLNMPSKTIWKLCLLTGIIVYFALFVYALDISDSVVKVVYIFIFYLFFVSFMEEYIYRGLVPALQKNRLPKALEWILPNIVFTLSHFVTLFAVSNGASGATASDLARFFITTMIFGLLMELLKRKSNSLYIPVLAHAIYDFYGEIMLWL